MSTYATQVDVERYIEGWVTDDPAALERLIQRAEREIDRIITPINHGLPPTQVITFEGATAGSFTVEFNGFTTAGQPYGETGAVLQASLTGLSSIGAGHVTVLGNNPYTLVWDTGWVDANFKNNFVPEIVVDGSGLAGGATVDVAVVEGRRVNPLVDLNQNQAKALSNATCAQVEFRSLMGEPFFVRPQYDSVRGPDFTTTGRLPLIGPKVKRELSGTGLILSSGRAVAGFGRRGVGKGWATY